MSELVNQDVVRDVARDPIPGARTATATSRVMTHERSGDGERSLAAAKRVMTMVLEGEIGQAEMADVAAMLERMASNGVTSLVVDLSEVSHFDYRNVRPLMRRAEGFRELGGDIRLAGLSPYLHAIFRSAGANDAFDYFAHVADAVSSFNKSIFVQGR